MAHRPGPQGGAILTDVGSVEQAAIRDLGPMCSVAARWQRSSVTRE
jgi:hypothetical protein